MRDIRLYIWAVLVFLLTPLVIGANFTTQVVTVTDNVPVGETAVFEIHVTNLGEEPDRYVFSSDDFSYIVYIDDSPPEVGPQETGVYVIEVGARSGSNSGVRKVPLRVRSLNTGETQLINPIVVFIDPNREPGIYTPSIALSVDLSSEKIDPREPLIVNVNLRNRNPRIYGADDPLTIRISSDLFVNEFNTQLGSVFEGGEKTPERRILLDPYLEPGVHELTVEVLVDGLLVSSAQKTFEIMPYSDVSKTLFIDKSFLKSVTTIKVENNGNIDDEAVITMPMAVWQRLFTSSSHNFEVEKIDDVPSMVIRVPLKPKEQSTIIITRNYRLLALLVVLIIVSVIAYYILRPPIVLRKEASITSDVEKGVTKIKTRLFIKNRSSKQLRNVRIIDTVSGVASLIKERQLGTIEPTKVVRKKDRSTLLRWDLDVLEPFEERIITYRVKTPVTLVGDVTLPGMKVKYDLPSGREKTTHSSEVTITKD